MLKPFIAQENSGFRALSAFQKTAEPNKPSKTAPININCFPRREKKRKDLFTAIFFFIPSRNTFRGSHGNMQIMYLGQLICIVYSISV